MEQNSSTGQLETVQGAMGSEVVNAAAAAGAHSLQVMKHAELIGFQGDRNEMWSVDEQMGRKPVWIQGDCVVCMSEGKLHVLCDWEFLRWRALLFGVVGVGVRIDLGCIVC